MTEQEEFVFHRDQCNYIFKKGASKGQRCERMIPMDVGGFCKSHRKKEPQQQAAPADTPIPKKSFDVLPQKKEEEIPIPKKKEEEIPIPKKSFDVLPQKKEEEEEEEEIVDEDTEIIELPPIEEEEEKEKEEEEKGKEKLEDEPSDELVIQQIKLYYSNLPFLDQELPFEQQGHLSPQEWLNRINYIISDRTSLEILKLGFYTTASMVEHVGINWFSLRLQGYEQALRGNREVDEILKILKIKHLSSLQDISPEQKLLGIMLFSAISIHRLNGCTGGSLKEHQIPHEE